MEKLARIMRRDRDGVSEITTVIARSTCDEAIHLLSRGNGLLHYRSQ
jgi:hypothetical protein